MLEFRWIFQKFKEIGENIMYGNVAVKTFNIFKLKFPNNDILSSSYHNWFRFL